MMEWLKAAYGAIGADHPTASLIVATLIGAILAGGIWWVVGKQYRRDHPVAAVSVAPRPIAVPTPSTDAPLSTPNRPTPVRPTPDRSAPDGSKIRWDFLRASSANDRLDTLFGFGSGSAGFWVTFFRITGKNQSGEPLVDVKAHVVPQILVRHVPLQFELRPNERVNTLGYVIDPEASFVLSAPVPSPPHAHGSFGYTVSEYLSKIGGFEFVFEAKGIRFSHSFTFAEVKEMIELAEKKYGPKPPEPTVRKR